MKSSILNRLNHLLERHQEIAGLLAEPEIIGDQNQFRELSREYSQLEPLVRCYQEYSKGQSEVSNARQMLEESDAEMRALAEEELRSLTSRQEQLEQELQILLLPDDPNDGSNVFLEIRAGTGGAEAALFAGDLYKMYGRYAERKRWSVEILSESLGEHGGYKEIILRITGERVYSQLKFESGAHRVQRVPETESQGRIHTSACTVAILPEVAEVDAAELNSAELRIDTYRASGAGGQHVNKTDSAVRITHLPTGIVVECQDERSQHKNRARAMSLLKARLHDVERQKQLDEQTQTRRQLVGSGDRSERIRTYNFPQGRLTDHRINLTLYKLEEILAGDLNQVIEPLVQEHQAELLAAVSE